MDIIKQLLNNPIFVSAALGWFVAQVLKTIIYLIVNREFVWERLIGNGGMPSSHSATVCALATAFMGKLCLLNSDKKSIKQSLELIDCYCRNRLPDKL